MSARNLRAAVERIRTFLTVWTEEHGADSIVAGGDADIPYLFADDIDTAVTGVEQAQPIREDKRGRYLDNEGIGAGAEGDQLISWGGDIDLIEARNPHAGRVFLVLGMLGLDRYRSEETCPQVRVTLTDEHARQLAACINAVLDAKAGAK